MSELNARDTTCGVAPAQEQPICHGVIRGLANAGGEDGIDAVSSAIRAMEIFDDHPNRARCSCRSASPPLEKATWLSASRGRTNTCDVFMRASAQMAECGPSNTRLCATRRRPVHRCGPRTRAPGRRYQPRPMVEGAAARRTPRETRRERTPRKSGSMTAPCLAM